MVEGKSSQMVGILVFGLSSSLELVIKVVIRLISLMVGTRWLDFC